MGGSQMLISETIPRWLLRVKPPGGVEPPKTGFEVPSLQSLSRGKASLARFELATFAFVARCSNPLSYRDKDGAAL